MKPTHPLQRALLAIAIALVLATGSSGCKALRGASDDVIRGGDDVIRGGDDLSHGGGSRLPHVSPGDLKNGYDGYNQGCKAWDAHDASQDQSSNGSTEEEWPQKLCP
jgi:hypothetical protein